MYQLIVQEGLHAGATIQLKEGEYTIGSDDACDVILLDEGVAPTHLHLLIRPSMRVLKKVNQSAFSCNDIMVQSEQKIIELHDVIRIGQAIFTIISSAEAVAKTGNSTSAVARNAVRQAIKQTGAPMRRVKKPLDYYHYLITGFGLFMVILLGSTVWFVLPDPNELTFAQKQALRQETLAKKITAFKFKDLVVQKEGTFLKLSGYIDTFDEAQELTKVLNEYRDIRMIKKYYVGAELVEWARSYLNNQTLKITYVGQGGLEIEGSSKAGDMTAKIETLKQDYSGIIKNIKQQVIEEKVKPKSDIYPLENLKIIAIQATGDIRYFETANKTRYFEGSILPDGTVVASIGDAKITLEKKGLRKVYLIAKGESNDANAR
jgi:hypothetical protein